MSELEDKLKDIMSRRDLVIGVTPDSGNFELCKLSVEGDPGWESVVRDVIATGSSLDELLRSIPE